jgi:hypothetical protein
MIEAFDHDDEAYGRWVRANRGGYVVNAFRGRSAAEMRIHRASCATIFEERPVGTTWTDGEYVKICSPDREELELRMKRDRGSKPKACETCERDGLL